MKRVLVICLVLIGLLTLQWSVLSAEQALPLSYWIDRAIRENPEFQLVLADYNLRIEELNRQQEGGLSKVSFSLDPITVDNEGLHDNLGVNIQYGWDISRDLNISGGNSIQKMGDSGLSLTGSLGLSFDPLKLLTRGKGEEAEIYYERENHSLYLAKISLVKDVIDKYYKILISTLELEIAQKELANGLLNLEQVEVKYNAGLIPPIEYLQSKDGIKKLEHNYQKKEEDLERAKRDFAWIFSFPGVGQELIEEINLIKPGSNSVLSMDKIDEFLENWDAESAETYLERVYAYKEALLVIEEAENALTELKDSYDFKVNVSTGLTYGTEVEDVSFRGSVSVQKDLYDPGFKREVKDAESRLIREKLNFEKKKIELTANLIQLVEAIGNNQREISIILEEIEDMNEQIQRLKKQYELGFISEQDVKEAEITLLQKEKELLEFQKKLIESRLTLGEFLSIDEF